MLNKKLWITIFLTLNLIKIGCLAYSVSNDCMQCLCKAITGKCRDNHDCKKDPIHNDVQCGPFLLDFFYWERAGKPGRNMGSDNQTFMNCAGNFECASLAIRQYLKDITFDCTDSGTHDCYDIYLVHRHGVLGCRGQTFDENDEMDEAFEECFRKQNASKKTPSLFIVILQLLIIIIGNNHK